MLIKADASCLLVVDVQEKLVPAVHEPQHLVDNCVWLMKLARRLNVPMLVSEQYPKGLGPTVSVLRELAPKGSVMDKVHFSCAAESRCMDKIQAFNRHQVVIAGIEAHVCVLQTALNLREAGKDVFVVVDAISSRFPQDEELGLERMQRAGVEAVTKEMVLFEWLQKAGTPQFKALSAEFLS